MQHAHAAGESELARASGGKLDGGPPVGRQKTAHRKIRENHFLGAGIGLLPVKDDPNRTAAPDPELARLVPATKKYQYTPRMAEMPPARTAHSSVRNAMESALSFARWKIYTPPPYINRPVECEGARLPPGSRAWAGVMSHGFSRLTTHDS